MVVSGDSSATTAAVAGRIGADGFVAKATPAGKARIVEQLQRSGKSVAMIGDGVNDAPALAKSGLGIALGSGTDIAMKAAPVVLMSASLLKVLQVFDVACLASRVVRQNLFWAFLYNALGITLAITGVLTPIWAACAMLLSSVSVVVNSMRLSRWSPRFSPI
jgi:P-type E1-E2 ATPase